MATTTFTQLLRHPNAVVAQAEDGAVRITRRDAADLILVRAGEYDAQFEGVALASQIMRAVLRHDGNMEPALDELFSWTTMLSPAGRKEFADRIQRLVWSAAELGTYGELLNEFRSWRGTAEAIANGMSNTDPLTWIDYADAIEVERP